MKRSHNHKLAIEVASKLGLPVFPVREKDTTYVNKKSGKPVTLKAKAPYTRNGFKDATKDLEEIDRLWAANRNAAVGVPMGPETSLLTVDIDNGPDKVGMQTWEHTGLIVPDTVKTRTVSGGLHLIFKYPNNCIIRNSAGTIFGPDVDVRADGGYIVWAGSILENGCYQYLPGHSPNEVQFAEVSPEIMAYLTSNQKTKSNGRPSSQGTKEGSRNSSLFQEAVTQVHAGLDDNTVSENAQKLNATFDPPLDEEEVDRTIKSATGYRNNSQIPLTDLGNAERLKRDALGKLIYVAEEREWRVFDGQRWVRQNGAAERLAHETIRRIVLEASHDPDSIQTYSKWQKTSESSSRIKAALEIAATLEGMSVSKSELDQEKKFINFRNGTFELETGNFREHRASDFITKIAEVSYDPTAGAPRFIAFVNEIMDGNADDEKYLQKLTGYILSGERPEQIIQFFKGDGGDGKSVLMETIRKLVGDYQITLSANTFAAKNFSAIPNDIARIAGARLAGVSELPKGLHVNTQLLKGISGGDTLVARFLHQEFFDFEPEALLVICSNYYPFIDVEDKAFLRRVRLLRFPRNFSENAPDLFLRSKLTKELSGILNWALAGYKMYKLEGLEPTPNMLVELDRYQKFIDPLDGFYEDKIRVTNDISDFIPSDELFDEAQRYAWDEDRGKIEKSQLLQYMKMRGHERTQRRTSNGRVRGFAKIRTVEFSDIDLPF
jgi:P4 family phage/plasmid primase-like protien